MSFENNDPIESQTAGAETGAELTVSTADQPAASAASSAYHAGDQQPEGVPPADVFAPPGLAKGLDPLDEEMKPERVHGLVAVNLKLKLKDRKRKGSGGNAQACSPVCSLANSQGKMSFSQAAAFFAWMGSDLRAEVTGTHSIALDIQVDGNPADIKEAQQVIEELTARAFG